MTETPVTAEKDKEIEMMNEMDVEPIGLDDRLPCVVYLPPSLCLGLGTTVRTLLTALAQRRRWIEEGKLRGDLIQLPLDPTEKLAKMWGELTKKDAEIERLQSRLAKLEAVAEAVLSELSGNSSELRDQVASAIRGDGSDLCDAPWEILSDDKKTGWRGDADRAIAAVKNYLITKAALEWERADG